MEPSDGSEPKIDPSEDKSRRSPCSSPLSNPNLPRRSPPYTGSILPQSMPTEDYSFPSGPHDSGSSRGHSPYEYSQPGYGQMPGPEHMYPSYPLGDHSDPARSNRSTGGILRSSSEAFSSLGTGAFPALPPLGASGFYSPSPVYGYGSSGPGYSSGAYQDPYPPSSNMGTGGPFQPSYASGMSGDRSYGMYPGNLPTFPYGQPYPAQYQRQALGRGGFGPLSGSYGGQRRSRTTSYASSPGPPIVQPGSAKGPEGANLFIFHIPNDFSNQEMYDMFAQYGNVLSARIMVEAETGRSRGFGFVSFDSTESAANAIKHLNGFPIKGKRLKVQHKQIRGKDPYEAYSLNPPSSSVSIQQYVGHIESSLGEGYSFQTHLHGDTESKPQAKQGTEFTTQEPSDSATSQALQRSARHHTPVLPPMPPQPSEDDDEEAPGRTDDLSQSPLSHLNDISKALPHP
ncbi:hypothetical protein ACHAWX_003750 [Stephanocyclus meneghinianus]